MPSGALWQPAAPSRSRIVTDLSPSQSTLPSLQPASEHDAHCRIFVGDGSTGSGTLVAQNDATGLVLTCSHLFDESTADVVVAFPDGSRYSARLVDRDRANDLAALLIKRPDAVPIAVDDTEPTGVLSACGYGGDGHFRPATGAIDGRVQAVGASCPSVKITGAVRPGDSGGGVLNAAGLLVGVVWGCRDGETYFTCGQPLREFLDRVWPGRHEGRTTRSESFKFAPRSSILAPSPDLTARVEKAESDIAALRTSKQDRGEYLQVGDLNGYAKRTELPAIDTSKFATQDDVARIKTGAKSLVESLHAKLHEQFDERLGQIMPAVTQQIAASNPGLVAGLSYGKLVAGTLGVSGPLAIAVVVAGGLVGRRIKDRGRSVEGRLPESASGSRSSTLDPRPIAVDTPPLPQRVVPETHFVPVERDDFARAHQWASEHVARKYPGATEMLTTLDSLIKQQLAARKEE
jgi:Trypsin-like peptidase domain